MVSIHTASRRCSVSSVRRYKGDFQSQPEQNSKAKLDKLATSRHVSYVHQVLNNLSWN